MSEVLRDIIARNRAGEAVAIPSVCSAHPDVLRASLRLAQARDRAIVIEATSNQVNQDGGYTGMRPADFIGFVHDLADAAGVDRGRIVFGGDHLGPQAWRRLDRAAAMAKADRMVRDYVSAGFTKVHLDCSEGCAGEPAQLADEETAGHSAHLARAAAEGAEGLMFVVGTEVPPPGGARSDEAGDIPPTEPAAARATLAAHDAAFGDLAPQIGGLVVQPGVEFAPMHVHHLPMDRDPGLRAALSDHPKVTLEAHSTDYQRPAVYPRLAELGFGFQKVGPALTFAYRQALYALDHLGALIGQESRLKATVEAAMLADPSHWNGHVSGHEAALQRHFGLADRVRYYWPVPSVQAAVRARLDALPASVPETVLWQCFDRETLDLAEGLSGSWPVRLIEAEIQRALAPYFFAPEGTS